MRKKRNGFNHVICTFCGSKSAKPTFDFLHVIKEWKETDVSRTAIFLYECTLCKRYGRSICNGSGVTTEITKEDYNLSKDTYGHVLLE